MRQLFRNIRSQILIISVLFSLLGWFYVDSTIASKQLQIIRLEQLYALLSLALLYVTLLASPLLTVFPTAPFRPQYLKARRALGVSAFYFGLLHALLAFFGQLEGFAGLAFLSSKYVLAISLSFIALVILLVMAVTSVDVIKAKLGHTRWKVLHRFVYLTCILIVLHALMLGTHFQDLFSFIPQLFFGAFIILLLLEGIRWDEYVKKRFPAFPQFSLGILLACCMICLAFAYLFFPEAFGSPLGIHNQHLEQMGQDHNE